MIILTLLLVLSPAVGTSSGPEGTQSARPTLRPARTPREGKVHK